MAPCAALLIVSGGGYYALATDSTVGRSNGDCWGRMPLFDLVHWRLRSSNLRVPVKCLKVCVWPTWLVIQMRILETNDNDDW